MVSITCRSCIYVLLHVGIGMLSSVPAATRQMMPPAAAVISRTRPSFAEKKCMQSLISKSARSSTSDHPSSYCSIEHAGQASERHHATWLSLALKVSGKKAAPVLTVLCDQCRCGPRTYYDCLRADADESALTQRAVAVCRPPATGRYKQVGTSALQGPLYGMTEPSVDV